MSAVLRRITIYPIKSLDGVSVDSVEVLPTGSVANDRRFALMGAGGQLSWQLALPRSTGFVPNTIWQR